MPEDIIVNLSGNAIQTAESVHGQDAPKPELYDVAWPIKKSNVVIIQSCVPANGLPFDEALEWLKPIHGVYAEKWGYDYMASSEPVINTEDPNFSYAWNKVPLLKQALNVGYEYAIWIDHDCVIVDFDTALVDAFDEEGAEIMMCVHPGFPQQGLYSHFNAGVMMVHNSERTKRFLDLVWERRYHGPVWFEQDVMNELYSDFEWMDIVGVMSDKFNSTPNANQVEDKDVVIAAFHGVGTYNDVNVRLGYMKQFYELREVEKQIAAVGKEYIDPLAKE